MTHVVSSVSSKGGAGKTTVSLLVAGEWASTGKRVLMIENDERGNLQEWWTRCSKRGNLPANMEMESARTANAVDDLVRERGDAYDYVWIDSPGVQTANIDTIVRLSNVVVTPIQPNQNELTAAGQAAQAVGDASDQDGFERTHLNVVTRISMPGRHLEAYRLIRPYIAGLQAAGYHSHLCQTELTERNCYREIQNGYGTLQMLAHSEAVLKGRKEVRALTSEIDAALLKSGQKKAASNG